MKYSEPAVIIDTIDNDRWESIIDFTAFRKGGVLIDDLIKRLKCLSTSHPRRADK